MKASANALNISAACLLFACAAVTVSPQPAQAFYEEWTEEDDLGALMGENLRACRGYEADLLSSAGTSRFPKLYAQLSPKSETYEMESKEEIARQYADLVKLYKDETGLADPLDRYAKIEKLAANTKKLSDQQLWALVRSHYYLTHFQSKSEIDGPAYYRFSHNLLKTLLEQAESDLRDRAVLHIIANISALDVGGEQALEFQDLTINFLSRWRQNFYRFSSTLSRKIRNAGVANFPNSSIGGTIFFPA